MNKEKQGDTQELDTQKAAEEELKSFWCTLESKSTKIDSIHVAPDQYSIGRNAQNNTVIEDSKISGKHCMIMREKESEGKWSYMVQDLSANGTYLNGKKVGIDCERDRLEKM